jgi:hypothetical protein
METFKSSENVLLLTKNQKSSKSSKMFRRRGGTGQ